MHSKSFILTDLSLHQVPSWAVGRRPLESRRRQYANSWTITSFLRPRTGFHRTCSRRAAMQQKSSSMPACQTPGDWTTRVQKIAGVETSITSSGHVCSMELHGGAWQWSWDSAASSRYLIHFIDCLTATPTASLWVLPICTTPSCRSGLADLSQLGAPLATAVR